MSVELQSNAIITNLEKNDEVVSSENMACLTKLFRNVTLQCVKINRNFVRQAIFSEKTNVIVIFNIGNNSI